MPTFEVWVRFWADFERLSAAQQVLFLRARDAFVQDLRAGIHPRSSLRVKRIVTHSGVWELSWAPDGRPTFAYGAERIPGQPHIIWRRIGTHDIFRQP